MVVHHHRPRIYLPWFPGLRVLPRLQRAQPQAVDGSLRLDVLHADGIPRLSWDDRRNHADGDALADFPRAFRRAASFRVRSRRVVLAFRRRRLALAGDPRVIDQAQSDGRQAKAAWNAFRLAGVDMLLTVRNARLQRSPFSPIHPKS